MNINSKDNVTAAPKPDDSTPAADTSHPTSGPPTPATPATTPADPEAAKTAGAALVLGGLLLAGMMLGWSNDDDELDILNGPRLQPQPETIPPRPPEPIPAPLGPVVDRPKIITYLWCWRCTWLTPPDELKRVVPSASSRSQYHRIATRIELSWGKELDARPVSFEVLRWIAAAPDFAECQDRYMRVLNGERPPRLKAPRQVKLSKELLRAQRRRRTVKGRPARTMACACAPEETDDVAHDPPPTACHRRAARRRWEPTKMLVCGEGVDDEVVRMALIYAKVEELCKTQGVRFGLEQRAKPDSSCLPRVDCSGRQSRRTPHSLPPPEKRRGRRRLPGDHDWGW